MEARCVLCEARKQAWEETEYLNISPFTRRVHETEDPLFLPLYESPFKAKVQEIQYLAFTVEEK